MRIDELTNVLEGYPKILAIDINDNTSTMSFRLLDAITGGNFVPHKYYSRENNNVAVIIYDGEKMVNNLLVTLTEREAEVLNLRFGKYDGKTYTFPECAKTFNVTPERIRQIADKAIRKLRGSFFKDNCLIFNQECIFEHMLQPEEKERRKVIMDAIYNMSLDEELQQKSDTFTSSELKQMCTELHDIDEKARIREEREREEIKIQKPESLTIDELGLSTRAFKCLIRANIHEVRDLINKDRNELLKLRNMRRTDFK